MNANETFINKDGKKTLKFSIKFHVRDMALFVSLSGNVFSKFCGERKITQTVKRKNLLDGIGLTDEGRRVMTDVWKVFSGAFLGVGRSIHLHACSSGVSQSMSQWRNAE